MDRLGLNLLHSAPKDICIEGIRKLNTNDDPQELIEYFKKNIDFCLDNNFPDKETLLAQGVDFLKQNGLFIDQNAHLRNIPFLVVLGNSEIVVGASGFTVSQIFAKNSSKIKIFAEGNSHVTIDIFDDVEIDATANGSSKIFVNIYGSSTVSAIGKVVAIHKNREKY